MDKLNLVIEYLEKSMKQTKERRDLLKKQPIPGASKRDLEYLENYGEGAYNAFSAALSFVKKLQQKR